jgi:hypothetical protein
VAQNSVKSSLRSPQVLVAPRRSSSVEIGLPSRSS